MTYIIDPIFTNRQRQIIKGTILGGSSIISPSNGKNCYLSMRSKDGKWLDYKASELHVFSSRTPLTIEKTNRWHSLCYPIFSEFRKLFYHGKKRRLTLDALNDLQDIAFMIWYGDTGSYKNGLVTFNTNIWGKGGTEIVRDYFDILGYQSTILKNTLNLDEESSNNLLEMISPHLPHFFNH